MLMSVRPPLSPVTMAELTEEVHGQLRSILTSLRQRTERVKTLVEQPPSPADLSDQEGGRDILDEDNKYFYFDRYFVTLAIPFLWLYDGLR